MPTAYAKGLGTEASARLFLRLKGYRILAKRFKTSLGEIDIVARKGPLLVFVEVKRRASIADASEAVTLSQRLRIEKAAELFVQQTPRAAAWGQRFDVVLFGKSFWPCHILDAWRPGFRLK
jgi:putative endonuclease